jgi:hypothetical protein
MEGALWTTDEAAGFLAISPETLRRFVPKAGYYLHPDNAV